LLFLISVIHYFASLIIFVYFVFLFTFILFYFFKIYLFVLNDCKNRDEWVILWQMDAITQHEAVSRIFNPPLSAHPLTNIIRVDIDSNINTFRSWYGREERREKREEKRREERREETDGD
jgi:hypothetical protein